MDVRDRSTYGPSQGNLGIEMPSWVNKGGSAAPSTSSLGSAKDSSDLSPTAHLVAQDMRMPEIRSDRVASLQQQIASGRYQVAPHDVADAILRTIVG
jgi:negative regulator of flagellin synthesis FlgM